MSWAKMCCSNFSISRHSSCMRNPAWSCFFYDGKKCFTPSDAGKCKCENVWILSGNDYLLLKTPLNMAKGFHICICHLIVKKHVFHNMRNSFWCSLFYNNKSYNFLSALLQKHIRVESKMICRCIEVRNMGRSKNTAD